MFSATVSSFDVRKRRGVDFQEKKKRGISGVVPFSPVCNNQSSCHADSSKMLTQPAPNIGLGRYRIMISNEV